MPLANFYSGNVLDRAEHLRRDAAWLQARIGDPRSRFLPVWRNKNLVGSGEHPRPVWLSAAEAGELIRNAAELVFLGLREEVAYLAVDLSPIEDPHGDPVFVGRGSFIDLRTIGALLERSEGALLAYARGLLHWHRRHRYCGACGSATENTHGGHVRRCTNPNCAISHFPRTDPAVIMLVHDRQSCVLGRQPSWPAGMHSTLAGFVEPGESLEEAVTREVFEEVGLAVSDISYHSSQPWPFPSSIMLGFHVRARREELRIYAEELESARWFSREELLNSPEDDRFRLPRRDSIARRLIADWLEAS
jgi:NAD+ diphosphatase